MASEAQVAANRRNAQKSTGPTSPEGKRNAARNSIRHGVYCSFESMTKQEQTDFLGIYDLHLEAWDVPTDELTLRIVRDIALADYRRERIRATLFRMMAHAQMETAEFADEEYGEDLEIGTYDAVIFKRDMLGPNMFTRLMKLENSFTRQMARFTKDLESRLALLRGRQPAAARPPAPQPQAKPDSEPEKVETNPILPRSAACPCGSGLKYKRCCGKNAPPLLQSPPQAA